MKRIVDIDDVMFKYPDRFACAVLAAAIEESTPYEERPQGQWIIADKVLDYYHECPFCHWRNVVTASLENFCPNCGADLRGAEE